MTTPSPPPTERPGPSPSTTAIVLSATLLVGLVLRMLYIADEGYWFDELIIREQARMSVAQMLDDMIVNDVHPPLYQLLMIAWTRLVGSTSELWLRLPSVVFGVGAIGAVYALGRRMFDRRVGLWAAGALACNEYAVYYAQEARAYSLLLALSAVTVWTWWRLRDAARPRDLVVYGLCGLLLAYTHAFGLLLLVYLAIFWMLWRARGHHGALTTGRWFAVHVAMGLAYLPWVPSLLAQNARVQDGFWIPEPDWLFIGEYLAKYAGHRVLAWMVVAAVIGLVIWLARTRGVDDGRQGEAAAPVLSLQARCAFLAGWFVFLLLVPFVVSKIGQPIMHAKSAISVIVPLCLVVALFVARALQRWHWRAVAAVAWVGASLAAIVWTNYLAQNREGWREMSRAVAARIHPGTDLVVLYHPDYDYMYCYHYYLDPALPDGIEPIEMLCDSAETCAPIVDRIQARAAQTGATRLWLLKMRATDAFPPGLERHWQVVEREDFINGRLDRLEALDPLAAP